MRLNVAAATKIEQAQATHQDNSLKRRHNLEKHIINKRKLKVYSFPVESRPQEPESPSPRLLDLQLPKQPHLHFPPPATAAAALFHVLVDLFIKHSLTRISSRSLQNKDLLAYCWSETPGEA